MDLSNVSIKILECSIKDKETLDLLVDGFDGEFIVYVNVAKVEEDETFWVFETPSSHKLSNTTKMVSFKIPEGFNEGLYIVNHISLINEEKQGNIEDRLIVKPEDFKESLFEIVKDSSPRRGCSNLYKDFIRIMENREKEFYKGFGKGKSEYIGLVLVRDCKLTIRMRLGQYEVIPFNGISCIDEVNLIKSLLEESQIRIKIDFDEVMDKCRNEQPSFIIHFPRVLADSINIAASLIKNEAQIICDLLSVHRDAYPSILGMTLIGLNNDESLFGLDVQSYTGNLLGGMFSGEDPRFIKCNIEKAHKNEKIQLYLSLYNETKKENRVEFRYFRLWNILETIARSKGYVNNSLLDWQGNIIKNRRGNDRFIQDDAKELVFELIREIFTSSQMSETSLSMGLQQGKISEMIPIWYRHRNCVVHGGGCFHQDPNYCKRDNDQWINCKNAHDEIISKNGTRNSFNDGYLRALDETVKKIIDTEIR